MANDLLTNDLLPLIEPLTRRELEILHFLDDRLSNQEIADRLMLALSSVKWYTQQIFSKLGVDNRRQAVLRAREIGIIKDSLILRYAEHNLPAFLTPFVGRQAELKSIIRMLQDPDSRLLTLVGPGGIGKTRLAIKAAHDLINENPGYFRDGLFLIRLAFVKESTSIVSAIARCLGFPFNAHGDEPKEQLIQYLRTKQMLLILDNYEQLIDEVGVRLPIDLLAAAPGLHILITSRYRLNIHGEQLYRLEGMEVPEAKRTADWQKPDELLSRYSSLQFFQLCAQRVRPNIELNSRNLPSVIRICQITQGMPLGILLATAWIHVLEPEEIVDEIEHSLDILDADLNDLPQRQHNIRSVFDASWRLLSESERMALQILSVFRGNISREAAEYVGSISLKTLLALVDKCWIQRQAGGRYQMHELLKQYASEHLNDDSIRWVDTNDRLSAYYCAYLYQRQIDLRGPRQQKAFAEISLEIENIKVAWQWAVDHGQVQRIDQALESLCTYFQRQALFKEGEAACRVAEKKLSERMTEMTPIVDDIKWVRARVLTWQSAFTMDHHIAINWLHQAKNIIQLLELSSREQREALTKIYLRLADHYAYLNREEARQCYSHALDLSQKDSDEWCIAEAFSGLGNLSWALGEYDQAESFIHESLALGRRLNDRRQVADSLCTLGLVLKHKGQVEQVEQLHRQSLELYLEIDARWDAANVLAVLSQTLTSIGKSEEGLSVAQESLSLYQELGDLDNWGTDVLSALAFAALHSGQYSLAQTHSQRGLEIDYPLGDPLKIGFKLNILGNVMIVQRAYASAVELLKESVAHLDRINQNIKAMPLASLGYVYRLLEQPGEAGKYLSRALEVASGIQMIFPIYSALPAIALLAMDRGDIEWAIEVYSLACTHPFIAKSHWFEDIAGRQISSSSAALPPEIVTAAQLRGRSLNLWDFARNWLAEKW